MHAIRMLLAITILWADVALAGDGTEGCANLRLLELEARQGRLGDASIKCLSLKWDTAGDETRSDISHLLITDADAKADVQEYERLVEQHVRQVDPRDPDIAWRWVNVLSRYPERVEELLLATETAEDVGQSWTDDNREFRMARVHELRSEAALRQWQAIGAADEASKKRTRKSARQWSLYMLDHSNAGSPSRAVDICIEAGGDLDWCVGGPAYRSWRAKGPSGA